MTAVATTDIEFWEFVSCAKCHLPYNSEAGKSVPFWLTECGHIICNHHLNPNQSCASCGSTGILLVPLQQELDAPMSDWFKPIPSALDIIAYAAKFQQEVMARQIRFYRSRHQQIRTVMEKLRSENTDLKRTNEMLAHENEHLKQQLGYGQPSPRGVHEPQNLVNQNGKRPMLFNSSTQYDSPSNRPRTGSSPLHAATSTRLTIPIGQRTPELSYRLQKDQCNVQIQDLGQYSHRDVGQTSSRPMSQQMKKFAYIPPETPLNPTSLSHAQMAPKLMRPSQANGESGNSMAVNLHSHEMQHQTTQNPIGQQARVGNMGPPPVPINRLNTPVTSCDSRIPHNSSRRFVPTSSIQRPQPQPSTSDGLQRMFPRADTSGQLGTSGSWRNTENPKSERSSRFKNR